MTSCRAAALLARAVALVTTLAVAAGCTDGRSGKAHAADAPASTAGRVLAMARGVVDVPGGLVDVTAPVDGQVQTVAVREGDSVKAGQLLLRLAPGQQQQALGLALSELHVAQARQRAQQARLPGAQRQAQRLAEAVRAEAIDAQRGDEAQQALLDLQAAVAVAQAETALAQQKVAQARSLAGRLSITATQDASVLRLQVQPGAQVSAQAGRPLLTLLPARTLRVRAELNEAFASRVAVGTRARVRLDSDSAAGSAVPTAHVVRISPVFGASRLDDDSPARGSARVVDCFLEFDQPPPWRIGQSVRVEFHE